MTHYEKRDHSEYRQQYESKPAFIMTMGNLLSTNVVVSIDILVPAYISIGTNMHRADYKYSTLLHKYNKLHTMNRCPFSHSWSHIMDFMHVGNV